MLKQDNVTWLANIHADLKGEDSGSSLLYKGVRTSRRNSMLSQQSSGGLTATDHEPFGSNAEPGRQSIPRSSSTSMRLSLRLQPLDMPSDDLQDGCVAMKDSNGITENMKAVSPWIRLKRWMSMRDAHTYNGLKVGQCNDRLGFLSNANGQRLEKSVSFLVSTVFNEVLNHVHILSSCLFFRTK